MMPLTVQLFFPQSPSDLMHNLLLHLIYFAIETRLLLRHSTFILWKFIQSKQPPSGVAHSIWISVCDLKDISAAFIQNLTCAISKIVGWAPHMGNILVMWWPLDYFAYYISIFHWTCFIHVSPYRWQVTLILEMHVLPLLENHINYGWSMKTEQMI